MTDVFIGIIGDKRVNITRHAAGRFLDMRLEPTEISLCITTPDRIVASTAHPGTHNYNRGRLNLAVEHREDGTLNVITATWATNEAWHEDFAVAGYADGRKLRKDFWEEGS